MIKFKTKIGICLLGALLTTLPTFARQISLEEAIGNLSDNLSGNLSGTFFGNFSEILGGTRAADAAANLLYTESYENLNVAYVIGSENKEGYLILAADDLMPGVLGYSDTGHFDSASIPPAMKLWLQDYGRQLRYAIANGTKASPEPLRASHKAIKPLCDATWGQSAPFSNQCPEYDKRHTPAGCTATAMAQVMYAHKWPVTGTGKNAYISGSLRLNLSFDFETATFDWANMLPSYKAGYTAQEGAAVATLLEACGNAALMNYGPSASGAYPYNAIYGMVNFMKYDKGAIYLRRDFYPSEQWDEMIYNELANGRPVLYGGYTADYKSGHTFVVDGYSSDGYYHLNWGWSGLSNGYFLLTALDPADQGIGGSSSGYNYRQDAVINIAPAKEDSEYNLTVMLDGEFTTAAKNYPKNGTIEFTAGNDGYYTAFTLAESATTVMGVKLTPADGGEAVFYPGSELEFHSYYGESEQAYSSFTIPVSDLPASGEYIATPAFKYGDEIKEVNVKVGNQKSLKISIARVGVSIQDISVSRDLTASDIKTLTPLYSGKSCSVAAEVHNSGDEYLAMVKAGFANQEGTVLTWLDNVPVNIPDGGSLSVNFSGKLVRITDGKPLSPGDYTLSIYDEEGTRISQPVDVVITEAPSGQPVYDMKIKVNGALSGEGTGVDPYLVADEVNLDITVSVSSGLFDDVVALYAYYENNTDVNFSGESSNSKAFFVGPGQTQTNTYIIGTANFELNKTVYVNLYGWDSTMSYQSLGWFPQKIYMKRVQSGVDTVEAGENVSYDIYTSGGILVRSKAGGNSPTEVLDASDLPNGLYIVVVNTIKGTESFRILKR